MKFPQLAVGARFRYQGKIYCKTSPLAASAADGSQRMIPRSASIEALDGPDTPTPAASPLQQALDEHHALGRALLAQAAEGGDAALAPLLQQLDIAYAELLRRVG